MKRLTLPSLILLTSVTLLTGCFTSRAVDDALWPVIDKSWPGIKQDAEQVPGGDELNEFETFLAQRSVPDVKTSWPAVQDRTLRGIQARGYGPGVTQSLEFRLQKFDEAIKELR